MTSGSRSRAWISRHSRCAGFPKCMLLPPFTSPSPSPFITSPKSVVSSADTSSSDAVGFGRNRLSDARSSMVSSSIQVRVDSTEDIGTRGSSMAAGTATLTPPPSISTLSVIAPER